MVRGATVLLALLVLALVPTAVVAQQATLPPLRGYIGYDLHVAVYVPTEVKVNTTFWVSVVVDSLDYDKYVYFLRVWIYGCGVDFEMYMIRDEWVGPNSSRTLRTVVTPSSEGFLRVVVEGEYYFIYKGYRYYQYGFVAGNVTVVRAPTYSELVYEYVDLLLRYVDLRTRYDRLYSELESLRRQYEELSYRYQTLTYDYDRLSSTYRSLADMYGRLLQGHSALAESYSALQKSYSTLLQEHSRLAESYESLRTSYVALQEEYGRLVGNYSALLREHSELADTYAQLEARYRALAGNYSRLLEEYGRYRELYGELSRRYSELEASYRELLDSYRALLAESRELREEVASYQDLAQKLTTALLGLTTTAVVLLVAVAARVLRR